MAVSKKKQAHLWERDNQDWYVEPSVCAVALFRKCTFEGPIWDPACGIGRIVKSAKYCGLGSFGTDIIERTKDCNKTLDFLRNENAPLSNFDIVTNPPFAMAEEFVERAISILENGKKAAFLLPLVWMAGFSSKRQWLPTSPLLKIMPISPRPSMPPGQVIMAAEKTGNGTKDFGWFIWEKGYSGAPEIDFLNTKPYKSDGLIIDELLEEQLCEHQVAA